MARTVLLTGYSGFLGRYTLAVLSEQGWQVHLAGRKPPAGVLHAGHIQIDLERPETLAVLRGSGPFDAIVHLASQVGLGSDSTVDMFAPNVLATGIIAEAGKSMGIPLLFTSSVLVHGAASQLLTPASPVATDTAYGQSKWLGEALIEGSAVDYCILRMGGLFGRRGPGHLGLNRAIDCCLRGEQPTLVGSGSAMRNYLFVKDAANTIVTALEQGTRGVHLLGGPEKLSLRTMLNAICDTLSPGSSPLHQDGPEARDQVIERSKALGPGILFAAALRDIAAEAQACASD